MSLIPQDLLININKLEKTHHMIMNLMLNRNLE